LGECDVVVHQLCEVLGWPINHHCAAGASASAVADAARGEAAGTDGGGGGGFKAGAATGQRVDAVKRRATCEVTTVACEESKRLKVGRSLAVGVDHSLADHNTSAGGGGGGGGENS
jgi:hypothetical protein